MASAGCVWPRLWYWKQKPDKKLLAKKVYTVNFPLSLPPRLRYNFYCKSRGEVAERLKAAVC